MSDSVSGRNCQKNHSSNSYIPLDICDDGLPYHQNQKEEVINLVKIDDAPAPNDRKTQERGLRFSQKHCARHVSIEIC
jgi:hypothetical protein